MPHAHPIRSRRRRLGVAAERLPQRAELVEKTPRRTAVAEPLARPFERPGEPLPADRLQQVVDGTHLERRHGVAVVGGDEDDVRDMACPLQHVEARALRHLHVEEAESGSDLVDQSYRRFRVAGLTRQLEARVRGEQALHPRARRLLVVDDHAAMSHRSASA